MNVYSTRRVKARFIGERALELHQQQAHWRELKDQREQGGEEGRQRASAAGAGKKRRRERGAAE